MQYSLRALMIATLIVPPMLASIWSFPAAAIMFVWCAIAVLSISESGQCWRRAAQTAPIPNIAEQAKS